MNSITITKLLCCLVLILVSCNKTTKPTNEIIYESTFQKDIEKFTLRQTFDNSINDEFLAVYFSEGPMSYSSGNKILILYNKDSTSIAKTHFGCHPLIIENFTDSGIYINTYVSRESYDNSEQQAYIENFTKRNPSLEKYKLIYSNK